MSRQTLTSQLISALKASLELNGDLPIGVFVGHDFGEITEVQATTFNDGKNNQVMTCVLWCDPPSHK